MSKKKVMKHDEHLLLVSALAHHHFYFFIFFSPQAQTEHANRQAKYIDELERQRYATQLSAQRDARETELRRQEESVRRQEELRRNTMRYEAELRSKTELKRAEAEAQARAQSERENHDLSLERLRAEMKERRETLLQSISVGFLSMVMCRCSIRIQHNDNAVNVGGI